MKTTKRSQLSLEPSRLKADVILKTINDYFFSFFNGLDCFNCKFFEKLWPAILATTFMGRFGGGGVTPHKAREIWVANASSV